MLGAKIAAIEFVGDEVRVAMVQTGGRAPSVLALHSSSAIYEAPEARVSAMAAALDRALEQLEHPPAAYVLCLGSENAIVRAITIPFKGRRRVAAAVPFELEPYLAFPIEELLVDFNIVAEIDGETEVLAMGLRRSYLEEQTAILATAGIEAEAVTLDGVAMTGLWQSTARPSKGLEAVLHVRQGSACLAMVYNRNLAWFRHITCTADAFTENPAAVARDIQNTLRAFLAKWRGEGEIDTLHITGLELSPDERATLGEALRLKVEDGLVGTALKGGGLVQASGGTAGRYNYWEASLGAALAASGGGYSLDFQRQERGWETALRGAVTHLLFSSCLALLGLLGWAFYYYQGTAANNEAIAVVQDELTNIFDEIDTLESQMISADLNIDVFADPTVLDLLLELGAALPESQVRLDEIRMARPGSRSGWIQIQGSANNAAEVNAAIGKLRDSELFIVNDNNDIRTEGSRTLFRIGAKRRTAELGDES